MAAEEELGDAFLFSFNSEPVRSRSSSQWLFLFFTDTLIQRMLSSCHLQGNRDRYPPNLKEHSLADATRTPIEINVPEPQYNSETASTTATVPAERQASRRGTYSTIVIVRREYRV